MVKTNHDTLIVCRDREGADAVRRALPVDTTYPGVLTGGRWKLVICPKDLEFPDEAHRQDFLGYVVQLPDLHGTMMFI